MAFPLLGTPKPQFFDSSGDLLVSGTLSILEPTNDTNKTYYPTADDADAGTNGASGDITLNARGEPDNALFGVNGQKYKAVLKDSGGSTIWTVDDIEFGITERAVYVDDYAAGDGTTDDTAAIQSAAAALTSGGTLVFGAGKTYRIYPTGTLAGSAVDFCAFSSLNGVIIEGNGATLAIEDSLTTSEQIVLFKFTGCSNVVVENIKNTSDQTEDASSGAYGTNFVDLRTNTRNVIVRNCEVVGAMTGVRCTRAPATENESTKVSGVLIENCYWENVSYPHNFQNSGDDVVIRNNEVNYCHRSYFAYGVRNHDVSFRQRNTRASGARVAGYSTDSTTAYCENIRVNMTIDGYDDTTAAPMCEVVAIYDSAANGVNLRNINFTLNAKFNDSSSTTQRLLDIGKYVNGGGADSTASRGHLFENITLGGTVYGVDIASHEVCELFKNGDFTDETCRNIGFRDLAVTGGVNHVLDFGDLRSMTGEVFLENCYFDGTALISPTNWGSYGVRLRNTYILGQYFADSSYPRTYTSTGNLSAFHGLVYLDSSGGALAMTLPDGTWVGQEITIVMTDATASSTVSVTNHETTDPEVFTFAQVDDTLVLKWQGNQWITIANSGVAV